MASRNKSKTQIGLWFAIFLFSLLCQGQNAMAQWGLVDTVWCGTIGGVNLYTSPNDSFFLNGVAVGKTADGSTVYRKNDDVHEKFQKFINDSTIIIFKYLGNNKTVDTVKIFDFKNNKYLKVYNCSILSILSQSQQTYNSNLYSKYDNCVYGFGNEDETGHDNKTRKLNLETGEITEVPYLNGLAGGSISQDGELLAGYYFEGYWENSTYLYDQYFKVFSLKTGELIISPKPISKEMQYINQFPEFIFSSDHHYLNVYFYLNSTIWDLSSKTIIKQFQKIPLESGKNIYFTKAIFSNDSKRIFTQMSSMRDPNDSIMTDSTGYIIFDLLNFKEYRFIFPYGVGFGGKPQALVFNDNYLLTDGAGYFNGNYLSKNYISIGNSSLLKLNFNVNNVKNEEQVNNPILYPNPANGEVKINFDRTLSQETNLTVIDNNGRQIFATILPIGIMDYTLQTNNWLPGIFFIVIHSDTFSKTFKLMVEK